MFARITHYKMKPGSVDDAMAMIEPMKEKIMSMPGLVQFINTINPDGSGCVISINESKAQSEANQAQVASIWGHFADHLEGPPDAQGFEVFANWST